jgi:hypothetical protein
MTIKNEKCAIFFWVLIKLLYLQPRKGKWFGTLAQSVEQQTENLCVPGSIPGGTTKPTQTSGFFVNYYSVFLVKASLFKRLKCFCLKL